MRSLHSSKSSHRLQHSPNDMADQPSALHPVSRYAQTCRNFNCAHEPRAGPSTNRAVILAANSADDRVLRAHQLVIRQGLLPADTPPPAPGYVPPEPAHWHLGFEHRITPAEIAAEILRDAWEGPDFLERLESDERYGSKWPPRQYRRVSPLYWLMGLTADETVR
ncbi:hypothetical protein DFH09DRAFT_283137 [Mycena vulgaris]|nr:hypothetical protein DFH09DRAFT_283137 [Mycena vulgaris]